MDSGIHVSAELSSTYLNLPPQIYIKSRKNYCKTSDRVSGLRAQDGGRGVRAGNDVTAVGGARGPPAGGGGDGPTSHPGEQDPQEGVRERAHQIHHRQAPVRDQRHRARGNHPRHFVSSHSHFWNTYALLCLLEE